MVKRDSAFNSITDHAVKEQMIKEKEEYLIEMMKMSKRSNKPNEAFFELIDTSALYDIKERLEMANIMHSNPKLYNAIILIESTIKELKNITNMSARFLCIYSTIKEIY